MLRISSPQVEGIYQGSKFLKYQVLCDAEELKILFDSFPPFSIYPLSGLVDGEKISEMMFLEEVNGWIEGLKLGKVPTDEQLRKILASCFTLDSDALWMQEVPNNRYLIKMGKPVVQIQAHYFSYSPIDEVFRPMSITRSSCFWGIQFSFPTIYQDPKSMEFFKTDESINKELFILIKEWIKEVTRPTPFVVGGKKTNVPIRLGKNCFSWIHHHPQLIEQNIEVYRG